MISVERFIQVVLAILVSLGALLLSMGQEDPRLWLIATLAAAASVYLVDFKRWFWLNRTLANAAALMAVVASAIDFYRQDGERQLLAIANLLIYMQLVLLFQHKNLRVYWQLLVLSLLQVVVGAALNLGPLFGMLMVAYLFLAITTLAALFVFRELGLDRDDPSPRWRKARSRTGPASAAPSAPRRWPLAGRALAVLSGESQAGPRTLRRWGIGRQIMGIGLGTLVVAAILFFSVPRTGQSMWQGGFISPRRVVGYSERVRLGALGEVIQSPELVMRVEFRDAATDADYPLLYAPLFRGSVVNHYEQGQWRHVSRFGRGQLLALPVPPPGRELVRQRITIEPLNEPVVFCVLPAYEASPAARSDPIRYDPVREQLYRPDEFRTRRLTFEVLTPAQSLGRPETILLEPNGLSLEDEIRCLQLPDVVDGVDPLAGLKRGADEQVRWLRIAAADRLVLCRALEHYLRSPPFEYSLEGVPRSRGVDPLEDFVTTNQRGHCEYYASALVMMLRSQGIPARMAIGFRGGDFNSFGNFYEVRQRNAHTWVEAWLDRQHIPRHLWPGREPPPGGAWLTLDPTPGAGPDRIFGEGTWLGQLSDTLNYLQLLWTTYVVGLNAERQEQAIYQPFARLRASLTEVLEYPGQWLHRLTANAWQWFRQNWFSWRGAVAGILASLLLLALYRGLRRVVCAVVRVVSDWVAARRASQAVYVEFYRRFETLLARCGLRRAVGQTQMEFARMASAQLAELPSTRGLTAAPRRIVEAFYQVRFGRRPLDTHEAAKVEQHLAELEQALAGRAKR